MLHQIPIFITYSTTYENSIQSAQKKEVYFLKNKPTQFHIRPARPDEAGLFYAQHGAQEKPLVGRVTYANDDAQEFTDADEFIRCVQEKHPYRPTTGFHYEVLMDDPVVRKAVDDMAYDLYGEENPRTTKDYQNPPEPGMTFGGM